MSDVLNPAQQDNYMKNTPLNLTVSILVFGFAVAFAVFANGAWAEKDGREAIILDDESRAFGETNRLRACLAWAIQRVKSLGHFCREPGGQFWESGKQDDCNHQ